MMQKATWCDDMAYAFSVHRCVLWIFGSWPLQSNTYYSHARWLLMTLIEFSLLVLAAIDVFVPHDTHEATLENLLYLECTILALAKNFFPRIHVNKLTINIECAMNDWSTALQDKSSYQIMRKYARIGRLVILTMINCTYWYYCLWFLSIVFYPWIRVDSPNNGSTIKRNFLISFSWFTDDMSDSMYLAVFLLQISQSVVVGMRQTVVDSFFFSMVMHLCGQLQVLSIKCKNLGRYRNTNNDHKKELVNLVKRHCQLIELTKNIEDTFNVIILLQMFMSMILIALAGFGLIISVAAGNNVQILQNFLAIIYLISQCLFYSLAGDLIHTCSEQIFFEIYDAPWYKFTAAANKDVQFIMMRANVPLGITGGRFITISCKTMMNIVKSAMSYISVLSATMKD